MQRSVLIKGLAEGMSLCVEYKAFLGQETIVLDCEIADTWHDRFAKIPRTLQYYSEIL